MKLSNEQKGMNSVINTSVGCLKGKIDKMHIKIVELQKEMCLYKSVKTELGNAKRLVIDREVMLRKGMITQLEKGIKLLENNTIKDIAK